MARVCGIAYTPPPGTPRGPRVRVGDWGNIVINHEYQVQQRDGRRWVVLEAHPDRFTAYERKFEHVADEVIRGRMFAIAVRDFRVRKAGDVS